MRISTTATYRLFVFDFDGTIADTSDYCVLAAFAATLVRHQMLALDRDAIIARMGLPLPHGSTSWLGSPISSP